MKTTHKIVYNISYYYLKRDYSSSRVYTFQQRMLMFLRTPSCKMRENEPSSLAITRYHSIREVPGSVEMIPISFPELPKPSRTLGISQKPIF